MRNPLNFLVGMARFERAASASRTQKQSIGKNRKHAFSDTYVEIEIRESCRKKLSLTRQVSTLLAPA